MMSSILAADADELEEQEKRLLLHHVKSAAGSDGDSDDDDDSHTLQTSSSSPLVLEPLGMCIAFDDDDEQEKHDRTTARVLHYDEHHGDLLENGNEYSHHDNDLHVWWVLWRGPILVYTCLFVVPAISSFVMHQDTLQRVQEMHDTAKKLYLQGLELLNNSGWCSTVWCTESKEWIHRNWIEPALDYVCNLEHDETRTITWKTYTSVTYWAHRWNLCPLAHEEEEPIIQYRPVLDPYIQMEWKQDLAIVAAVSTALTAVRLLILLFATLLFSTKSDNGTNIAKRDVPVESNQAVESAELTASASAAQDDSLPGSAFFRTVCCTASATQAWRWFHETNFWPDVLLGKGQLDHCWDLIIPPDDASDKAYEEQNTLLRYYVLIQASYYVHSVTFRFVRWLVRRKRRTSLILSLIQSVLALGLLALAYGFSSLRRLAAIGMFALDVSSAIRYFWQACAPGAATANPTWIRKALAQLLYWTLVLPSFIATRFYIYPILWQSATSAQEWRVHLEQALWKGSAEQFLRLCNACIVLLLFMSVFSLHRLVDLGPYHRPKRRPRLPQQEPKST